MTRTTQTALSSIQEEEETGTGTTTIDDRNKAAPVSISSERPPHKVSLRSTIYNEHLPIL